MTGIYEFSEENKIHLRIASFYGNGESHSSAPDLKRPMTHNEGRNASPFRFIVDRCRSLLW